MVRRRQAQVTTAQVVLFGLVVREVEQLMVAWLRDVDRALVNHRIVGQRSSRPADGRISRPIVFRM